MEFDDTPTQQALRKAVAAIVGEFGAGYYAAHAHAGEPCTELWHALGGAGDLGVNVPEEYGGGGAGLTELAIVCEEIAAQGCPLLLVLVSSGVSGEIIARYGSPGSKQRWLPGLADGTGTIVFAITEPDAGSNTHKLSTTASRDGDGWVVRGAKYFISGVDQADAILVVARTGTDERDRAGAALALPGPHRHAGPDRHRSAGRTRCCPTPVHAVLRRRPAGGRCPGGCRGGGFRPALPRAQPRARHGGGRRGGGREMRAQPGRRVRADPDGVGHTDRCPPGSRPPARQGEDRNRTRGADDAQGRMAARPRAARRGGVQHGQVRRRRGGRRRRGPGHPDPRRERR